MIDVSVKTLDGQTKSHSVADDTTVRQFKETIASSISIPADTQRLIFQGRVLQDEKLLRDFNVHGKVIHVVQRPPPRPNSTSPVDNGGTSSSATASAPPPPSRDVNSFVVGSFTLPSEILDPTQVQNIVQQAVHNMGELGRNARVSTRASFWPNVAYPSMPPQADGSAVDVHINLGQIPVQQTSESQQRVNHIKKLLHLVKSVLSRLENPSLPSSSGQGASEGLSSSNGSSNQQGSSGTSEESASTASSSSSGTSQQAADDSPNAAGSGQGPSPPPVSVLAELMEEIQEVQRRLQPYLTQYTTMAQSDPTFRNEQTEERRKSERIFNLVSESLHYLSHIYHSISDLTVDLTQPPPRHLHAHTAMPALSGLMPSSIPTGTIPLHGQYRMPGGNLIPNFSALSASTRPSTNVGSTSSTATSTTATSTPRTTTATSSTTLPSTMIGTSSSQAAGGSQAGSTPISLGQSFSTSSSSPYLFVEVGPDSLIVNSISAHVVSSDASTPTSNTSSSMQRTFQVNLGPTFSTPPTATSTTSSSNTTSSHSTTSSTVTSSGSGGAGGGATNNNTTSPTTSSSNSSTGSGRATVVLPGGVPNIQGLLGSQHSARTIDPYLPCMSRHFLSSQAQTAATASNVIAAAAANIAASATQQASNQGTDTALGDVVAAVMAGLLGTNESPATGASTDNSQAQNGNTSTQRPNPTAVSIPQISQAIGGLASPVFAMVSRNLANLARPQTTTTTTTTSSTDTSLEPSAFVQTLRNLLQGAARVSGPSGSHPSTASSTGTNTTTTTTTRSSTTASTSSGSTTTTQSQAGTTAPPGQNQSTSGNQVIPDEAIIQLIRGIGNNLTQAATGQQNVGTIWDFFSTIGEELDIEQFEGFTNDIFQCVARHLTIPDLMTVLLGNTEPLNRLRVPLRELVLHQILNDAEPTEANVQNAVLQLLNEMREEIRAIVAISEVQPNIDADATLNNFLKQQYTKIIMLTIQSEDNNTFGQSLYDWFKCFLSELIVLGRFSLVDGYPAFQRVVHDRLQHLTNGINVIMQQSMITMATVQLNGFTPQETDNDIQHYIVWKDASSAAATNKEPAKSTPKASSAASPMEVDTDPPAPPLRSSSKPDTSKSEGTNRALLVNGVHRESAAATTTAVPPSILVEHAAAATPSNVDDWCSVVPAEWVPIIRQDIQQQRRQNSQPPFSDAYLNGMPAKRRKMNPGKPTNLSEVSEFVPDSLKKAVASAGVEPLSSLENLSTEAAHDSTLHSAFEDQMCNSVLQRIHLDSDYNPEMFPNTEEYFKKQQQGK